MNYLSQLRSLNPQLEEVDDDEIIKNLDLIDPERFSNRPIRDIREEVTAGPKPKGLLSEMKDNLIVGGRAVQQGYYGGRALLSDDPEQREQFLDRYREIGDLNKEMDLQTPGFTEIESLGDFGRWATGMIAQQGPIVGSIMAGGAATGFTGARVGALAGPKGAAIGGLVGSTIGSFSVGYKLYAGGLYGDLVAEKGADHEASKDAALLYGAPAAAVSIVVPAAATASIMGYLGKDFLKQRMRNAVVGAGIGSVAEGAAEGIAESFVIAGERAVLGEDAVSPEEAKKRIIEAAAAGSLLGTLMGGVGGGGRKSGDIDTMIDTFLSNTENQAKNIDRATYQKWAIERLRAAESLSPEQQQLLQYLEGDTDGLSNRALNKADRQVAEIAVEVSNRSPQENIARAQELVAKQEQTKLTGSEAIEMMALLANSQEARQIASQAMTPTVAGMDPVINPAQELEEVEDTVFEEFSSARLRELEQKAQGTPDQVITGPDGKPVTIPGSPKGFLTDAEKRELEFLRQTGDMDSKAKAYGFRIRQNPLTQADEAITAAGEAARERGGDNLDAALAEAEAAETAIPDALERATQQAAVTADPQGLLSQSETQPATGGNWGQLGETQPSSEPVTVWTGRRGDGYATEQDAINVLPSREKANPDLDWRVQQMPSGRFQLVGYAKEAANVPDAENQYGSPDALDEAAVDFAGTDGRVDSGTGVAGDRGTAGVLPAGSPDNTVATDVSGASGTDAGAAPAVASSAEPTTLTFGSGDTSYKFVAVPNGDGTYAVTYETTMTVQGDASPRPASHSTNRVQADSAVAAIEKVRASAEAEARQELNRERGRLEKVRAQRPDLLADVERAVVSVEGRLGSLLGEPTAAPAVTRLVYNSRNEPFPTQEAAMQSLPFRRGNQSGQAVVVPVEGGFAVSVTPRAVPQSDQAQVASPSTTVDTPSTSAGVATNARSETVLDLGRTNLRDDTAPAVGGTESSYQSAGRNARAKGEAALERWAETNNQPAPVTLGNPPPASDAAVGQIATLLESQFGGRVYAYSDPSPMAMQGVAIGSMAFINVADPQANAMRNSLHEFKHTVEQIAAVETERGLVDTPAQQFTADIESIFDDMTEEGKRAYAEVYLYKDELEAISDPKAREARLQELLEGDEIRSEMTADFLGNRALDKAFWHGVAKADPKGFKGFVGRWVKLIDNLLDVLKGKSNQGMKENARVDKYVRDLEKAKQVAQDALVAYSKATRSEVSESAQSESGAAPLASRRQADFTDPEDRMTVSTAQPTAKKDRKTGYQPDSYTEKRVIDSEDIKSSKKHVQTIVNALRKYNTLSGKGGAKEVMQELHDLVVENLLWLHDSVSPEVRKRAKLWYDGANRIANDWSGKFGLNNRQTSGILAVLSPQMDWFKNVSLGERVLVILGRHGNETWSDGMTQWAESWLNASPDVATKTSRSADLVNMRRIAKSGKKLKDMSKEDAAYFVRAFDEAYFSRNYRLVTPEGGFDAFVVNDDGETLASVTWGGFGTIEKAVAIFRDGSFRTVDQELGGEHKVRNFYNNIIDPKNADGHVTIDTHAVAAAFLKPLSGTAVEVAHNLGGLGSNAATGASGSYALFADAYRDAAAQRGLLAREMQSITWEAVRALFPAAIKSSLSSKISEVWDRVKSGEITRDQAREEIVDISGGIRAFAWEDGGTGSYASDGATSFETSVAKDPGKREVRTLEPKDAKDKIQITLSAATNSIPGIRKLYELAKGKDTAAHALLQNIAFDSLKHLLSGTSANIKIEPTTGLYGGASEPSLALTISFADYDRGVVLSALERFAQNFNQEQVHVRQGTKDKVGTRYDDGSYATPTYRWDLSKTLDRKQIQKVIDQSGLYGLTLGDTFVEAYYVGDVSNEAAIQKFEEGIARADRLLGKASSGAKQSVTRLWPYGYGDGAIGYDRIRGDIPPREAVTSKTAKRVAEYLKGAKVKPFTQASEITPKQVKLQAEIARLYESLPDNDLKNPRVRKAYAELAKEVVRQFNVLPVKVEVMTGQGEPYANSAAMRRDILDNNHLYIFGTTPDTFGPEGSDFSGHPLLQDTGLQDQNGQPLLANDLLRAVHDYYAHAITPVEFGPRGEEAAWKNHMSMTSSPWARWALTSETRGQNSWVNFRPNAKGVAIKDRPFAPQKTALLPIEYAMTGDKVIDSAMRELASSLSGTAKRGSKPDKVVGEDVMFSRRQADVTPQGFYSALSRNIEALPDKPLPGIGWKAAVKAMVNKGQVKQDEVEWTGINEWLDLQQGKVTKEAVQSYLQSNGVQVEEFIMGEDFADPERDIVRRLEGMTEQELRDEYEDVVGGDISDYDLSSDTQDRLDVMQEIASYYIEDLDRGAWDEPPTKYRSYTVPGGQNYREVLLTLPEKAVDFKNSVVAEYEKFMETMRNKYGDERMWSSMTDAESDEQQRLEAERYEGSGSQSRKARSESERRTNYRSSHWDQPNVLAHIRLDDRTDADGNKVLFVQEIQSDWGQDGRKEGFKGRTQADAKQFFGITDADWAKASEQDREAYRLEMMESKGRDIIPSAPFVTKTDAWVTLALKRITTMAAQEGYDRVAIINGEQAADLYDLSKKVDAVYISKNPGGKYDVSAQQDRGNGLGDVLFEEFDVPLSRVEELVGKDLAEKAEAQTKREAEYRGLDLKVGGEGMRSFYDQIVPSALNKLLKKVGGTVSKKETLGNAEQVVFDVTPEIRSTVAEVGVPLFSRRQDDGDRDTDLNWLSGFYPMERDFLRNEVDRLSGQSSIPARRQMKKDQADLKELDRRAAEIQSRWGFTAKEIDEASPGGMINAAINKRSLRERNEGARFSAVLDNVARDVESDKNFVVMTMEEIEFNGRESAVDSLAEQLWYGISESSDFEPNTKLHEQLIRKRAQEMVDRVSQSSDTAYLAAVESGDMETAQMMVDEAAKAAGYTIGPVYRGGTETTSFDSSLLDDSEGFFFTDSEEVAAGYVPLSGYDMGKIERRLSEATDAQIEKIADALDIYEESRAEQQEEIIRLLESADGDPEMSQTVNDVMRPLGENGRDYVQNDGQIVKAYLKIENPREETRRETRGPISVVQSPDEPDGVIRRGFMDAKGSGSFGDGAVSTIYSVKTPEQIKSADPVTYDDAGNVIPLSQRFGGENDIRFSRKQTQTPAFKRWFGDSKVVDENGEPLVVYHGGEQGITSFRAPFFGTPDREGARWYEDERGGGIYETYLSVQKPLMADSHAGMKELVNIAIEAGVSVETDINKRESGWSFFSDDISKFSDYDGDSPIDLVYIPKVREALQAKGYDGVYLLDVLENQEIPTWVAFQSEQIKSATGNSGAFDPNNPDIRYSRAQPKGYSSPKVDSRLKDMLKLKGMFESASDKLLKTKGLEKVGEAIRIYYDGIQANRSAVAVPERKVRELLNGLSRKQRKELTNTFAKHRAAVENGRTNEAAQLLQKGGKNLQTMIDAWAEIADTTGDMARDLGVKVFDGQGYRLMGKVPNFWPRTYSEDAQRAMDAPMKHPEMWNKLVDAIVASGKAQTADEAAKYLLDYKQTTTDTTSEASYFAGIEKARKEPLPEIFYDYSWDAGLLYKEAWAERLAQIEAFGQRLGDGKVQADIFDEIIGQVQDHNTQRYLKQVRSRVYNERHADPITQAAQTLNALATGLQLGNPATAMLNLISGSGLTFQSYGVMRSFGSLVDTVMDFRKHHNALLDLGAMTDDYLAIMHDNERAGVPKWLSKATSLSLKYGGYTPAEHFIRTHAMVTGKAFLRDIIKTMNARPDSTKAGKYARWLQENNFELDRLLKENGKGDYTDRFIRYTINLPQGSYKIDQTPVYVDTQMGRFLFKYQKFGTQLTRMFWKNHLRPFTDAITGSNKVTYDVNGVQYTQRVTEFLPMLRFFAVAVGTGIAVMDWREELFGYQNKAPTWGELEKALADDDTAKAVALGMSRAFEAGMAVGMFGFFGNYFQMGRDVADMQRVKNPLDPPALGPLKAVGELVIKAVDQQTLSARDIEEFIQQTVSGYRTGKRLTSTAAQLSEVEYRPLKLEAAKKDTAFVKKMTRRYANEVGLEAKRRSSGTYSPTVNTPFNNRIVDMLLLGETAAARVEIRDYFRDRERFPTQKDRDNAMQSLKSSIRSRDPSRIGIAPSEIERRAFLRWAKENTTAEEYARISRITEEYRKNARSAGLL